MMYSKPPYKKRGGFFFLFIVAALFGLSAAVMLLWNALLPGLVHAGTIDYWQAMGLLILCRILFGGFHFRPGHRRGPFGQHPFRQKFMSMSEEQKSKFREEWKGRCQQ